MAKPSAASEINVPEILANPLDVTVSPPAAEIEPPSIAVPTLLVSITLPSENILALLIKFCPVSTNWLVEPVASILPVLVKLPLATQPRFPLASNVPD